jgi:hypothetical protein
MALDRHGLTPAPPRECQPQGRAHTYITNSTLDWLAEARFHMLPVMRPSPDTRVEQRPQPNTVERLVNMMIS